jgi:hypothetical protein
VQESDRRSLVEGAISRIAEMNMDRDDDFQDKAMGELLLAFDAFRPAVHDRQPGIEPDGASFEGDLAATGDDQLLDALRQLGRELDASPETVTKLCERALALTETSAAL